MADDETTALAQVAVEVGLDVAGPPGLGPLAKYLYRRSSQGTMAAELAKVDLEEAVASNLNHHIHSEVETYLDELLASDRADQVGQLFEEAAPEERPAPADLVKIARALAEKAAASIDTKKRRLLAAAVMNSFDPVLYQLGMTEDLLRILDDLTYADAIVLNRFGSDAPPLFKDVQQGRQNVPSIDAVQKLIRLNLVNDGTQRHQSYVQLEYSITARGRALLLLLADEEVPVQ